MATHRLDTRPVTAVPLDQRGCGRALPLPGSAGNLIEWFDFYVYALYRALLRLPFFPSAGIVPRSY